MFSENEKAANVHPASSLTLHTMYMTTWHTYNIHTYLPGTYIHKNFECDNVCMWQYLDRRTDGQIAPHQARGEEARLVVQPLFSVLQLSSIQNHNLYNRRQKLKNSLRSVSLCAGKNMTPEEGPSTSPPDNVQCTWHAYRYLPTYLHTYIHDIASHATSSTVNHSKARQSFLN